MAGIDLIQAERIRQVESEGYTAEKDAGHEEDLLLAAASYLFAVGQRMNNEDELEALFVWPWDERYFKPGDNKRALVKAGALIAAAIDAMEGGQV